VTTKTSVTDDLRARLGACENRQQELFAERSEIAFAAMVEKQKAAVQRLEAINNELSALTNERSVLESALVEATRRETAAEDAARAEKRRSDLRTADALLDDAEKIAQEFDDALRTVREAAVAFEAKMIQVRRLTGTSPQHDAIRVFLFRAIRTALHQSPVHIDAIAPSERTALMPVFQSWAKSARVLIANTLKTAAKEAA
jgi:hypothetical protein